MRFLNWRCGSVFRGCLAGLLVVLSAGPGWGEGMVTARLSPKKLSPGEMAALEIRVSGVQKLSYPKFPTIPGVSFTACTHTQQTTVINNQVTRSILFTCNVVPEKPGTYTIDGITIDADGATHKVPPASLEVIPGHVSKDVIVQVNLSKKEPYLGEPVMMTFDILFQKEVRGVDIRLPWFPPSGFLVADPGWDDAENRSEKRQALRINSQNNPQEVVFHIEAVEHDGRNYTRCRFQRLLTPIVEGEHRFDGTQVLCDLIVGYERRKDPFFSDPFFEDFGLGTRRNAVTRQMAASAEPVSLVVRALPETGRPNGFQGAVGHFDIDVAVSPSKVRAGDPVTLTVKVSGTGNLDSVSAPPLGPSVSIRAYEPEVQTRTEPAGMTFRGEKTFKVPLVLTDHSVREIPAVRFSFFDPDAQEYKTITRGPFPIEVLPGDGHAATGIVEGSGPGTGKVTVKPAAGIFQLRRTALREFRNQVSPFYARPLFLLLLPLPAFLCIACFLLERRIRRLGSDIRLQRSQRAMKEARRRLRVAYHTQGPECFEKIAAALTGFLADKQNLPSASIDSHTAQAVLKDAGVPEDLSAEFVTCLERCDLARFGGGAAGTDRSDRLKQADRLLARLGKELR